MKTTKQIDMYYVQEIIGGWKQNAIFQGTYEECQEYMAERCHNGSYSIVPEWDYGVDYL